MNGIRRRADGASKRHRSHRPHSGHCCCPARHGVRVMFKWLKAKWYESQREIDIDVLWPSCLEQADSIEQAKMVFAVHAYNDPAWQALGPTGIYEYIEKQLPLP